MKMKPHVILAAVLAAACIAPALADKPAVADKPATVEAMTDSCLTLSAANRERVLSEWSAQLPAEGLLDTVRAAERSIYTPVSGPAKRAVYRALLERLIAAGGDEYVLMRYEYQLEMLSHNNEGDVAQDFAFTDIDGNERMFTQVVAPYVLLIFNDPDCDDCAALRAAIVASPTLLTAQQNGRLQVAVIYPDIVEETWAEAMSHYPATWVKGYAEEVSDLYDVRQLPTTYLLDATRTVLLRDATVEEIATAIR